MLFLGLHDSRAISEGDASALKGCRQVLHSHSSLLQSNFLESYLKYYIILIEENVFEFFLGCEKSIVKTFFFSRTPGFKRVQRNSLKGPREKGYETQYNPPFSTYSLGVSVTILLCRDFFSLFFKILAKVGWRNLFTTDYGGKKVLSTWEYSMGIKHIGALAVSKAVQCKLFFRFSGM